MNQLNDAMQSLHHFKTLHQKGKLTSHYLEEVRGDLMQAMEDLDHSEDINARHIQEYIEAALHEIHVAQHLETYGEWPDAVPLFNEHGEFSSEVPHLPAYGHSSEGHAYQTYGHRGYMANGIEEASNAADEADSGVTINIKGPVIIAGDGNMDVASLLAQALGQEPTEISDMEHAKLMALQQAPPPQKQNWR